MYCKNIFLVVMLVVFLFGTSSCVSQEQKSVEAKPAVKVEAAPTAATTAKPAVKAQVREDDEVIIRYGDKVLTLREIGYVKAGAGNDPRLVKRVADWWLDTQILANEAIRQGLDKTDAAKFKAELGVTHAYADLLDQQLQKAAIAAGVTDEEVLEYYEENKDSDSDIQVPVLLSFSHISLTTREQAEAALARVKGGEDINKIAKEISANPDAPNGGTSRRTPADMVAKRFSKKLMDALLSASEGDFVGPVEGKPGQFEVARHEGKLSARIKTFEEVKGHLKEMLTQRSIYGAKEKVVLQLKKEQANKIKWSRSFFEKRRPPQKPK